MRISPDRVCTELHTQASEGVLLLPRSHDGRRNRRLFDPEFSATALKFVPGGPFSAPRGHAK
jgi:hypothetical protein